MRFQDLERVDGGRLMRVLYVIDKSKAYYVVWEPGKREQAFAELAGVLGVDPAALEAEYREFKHESAPGAVVDS